jgi:putative pyruvate formate lyase activating enzyme
MLHFGEEPPIVGERGSGTVFFAHCNLRCLFCQNHQISQEGLGQDMTWQELAAAFLDLQERGAENLNLVTPTHYMLPIARALHRAYEEGLRLPLVYNTNGYDSLELLALLEGVVDIYLPDLKYLDAACAERCSGARAYPETAQAAVRAMHAQVGALDLDAPARGVIVRHLVLPANLSQSYEALLWLADEGMLGVPLSLMSQYAPHHRAGEVPGLQTRLACEEYGALVEYAQNLGFEQVLVQELESQETYVPDFRSDNPFNDPRAIGDCATGK